MNEDLKSILKSIIDEALEPIKQDIGEIKLDIGGMKQDIGGMKQDIVGMKQDIVGMKQDIVGMKQDIVGMKQDIGLLQLGNVTINQRLDRIELKQEAILEQVVSNSESVSNLKEGQERQDRILESLAVHSLEQETIIRELKRIK